MTPDQLVNRSTVLVIGETANLSCCTTSIHSVDFYYQSQDGASPVPIYANSVTLDDRYRVVPLTGECREVDGGQGRHSGPPGAYIAGVALVLNYPLFLCGSLLPGASILRRVGRAISHIFKSGGFDRMVIWFTYFR